MTFNIFLVRHGSYNSKNIDPNEGLSDLGKEEVLRLKDFFKQENIVFDKALCSTKTRALDTGKILCGDCKLEQLSDLSPSSSVDKAYDCIPRENNVLVVTHLPLLNGLSERFGELVSFEPSTMAHFTENGLERIIFSSIQD